MKVGILNRLFRKWILRLPSPKLLHQRKSCRKRLSLSQLPRLFKLLLSQQLRRRLLLSNQLLQNKIWFKSKRRNSQNSLKLLMKMWRKRKQSLKQQFKWNNNQSRKLLIRKLQNQNRFKSQNRNRRSQRQLQSQCKLKQLKLQLQQSQYKPKLQLSKKLPQPPSQLLLHLML